MPRLMSEACRASRLRRGSARTDRRAGHSRRPSSCRGRRCRRAAARARGYGSRVVGGEGEVDVAAARPSTCVRPVKEADVGIRHDHPLARSCIVTQSQPSARATPPPRSEAAGTRAAQAPPCRCKNQAAAQQDQIEESSFGARRPRPAQLPGAPRSAPLRPGAALELAACSHVIAPRLGDFRTAGRASPLDRLAEVLRDAPAVDQRTVAPPRLHEPRGQR